MAGKSISASGSRDQSFPITVVGGSAESLDTWKRFFSALPSGFNPALVFVPGLGKNFSPEPFPSLWSDLTVTVASDGLQLAPGQLYLCRPGDRVRIDKNVFRVGPGSREPLTFPVDELLISLAEFAPERAVAVILSGEGTDGARGVPAIKAAGGIVFVQDPATAELTEMPLAAIRTGQVDSVLSPEDIAREIGKLQGTQGVSPDGPDVRAFLEPFYRIIYEKTGYRFHHHKQAGVVRRITRRMFLHGISSATGYLNMLAEKDAEVAMLASDLMIGVTSFFRDFPAWDALRSEVLSNLVASEGNTPIRVWTPACATGEEAYSITMLLQHELDLAAKRREIQVFATDINDQAIERARAGLYPAGVAADLPPGYLEQFFRPSDDSLSVVIDKEIRQMVVFAKQDLLADPPFSHLDLIVCRNLLIYLEADAQERCMALFHYALKTGGHLFLGNAETPGPSSSLFTPLEPKKWRIYKKVGTAVSERMPSVTPFAYPPTTQSPKSSRQSPIPVIQEMLLKEHGPTAVAINQNFEILYYNGPTKSYLSQPHGAPTQNLLEFLPEKLRNRVRGGLLKTAQESEPVSIRAAIQDDKGRRRNVILRISKARENLFLVVFKEIGKAAEEPEILPAENCAAEEAVVRQLEQELSATRDDLQSHIEQLKGLNEELHSSNEELQAANEELETSREELQSLNEELTTVNAQLRTKIEEEQEANNDLNNFVSSTKIPTIFLDRELHLKRFTPAVERLVALIPGDVGRPIGHISSDHFGPDLIGDAEAVLTGLAPVSREVRITGTWYVRTTLPYRTFNDRIEGIVVTYVDIDERKQAEERMRHLASFPELNPNIVIEVDRDRRVTFCNWAAENILESLGFDKGNIEAFFPQDLDAILTDWDGATAKDFSREIALGSTVLQEHISLAPRFGVARLYAFDITDRKRAEEALRESEQRFRTMADWTYDWEYWIDTERNVVYTSPSIERVTGYPADAMLSDPGFLDRIVHPEDRRVWDAHVLLDMNPILRDDPVELTFRIVTGTGEVRWIAHTCRWVFSEAGEPIGRRASNRDITERVIAEAHLRESEERYRGIFENAVEGIYQSTPDRRPTRGNHALAHMYGYDSPEEMLREVVDGKELYVNIEDNQTYKRLLEEEGVIRGFEVEQYRKDGSRFWVSINARAVKDAQGKLLYYDGIVDDISKRKALEDELRQAQKMEAIGTLAGGVAHDFNNILTVITGFGTLVQQAVGEDRVLRPYVDQILASSEKAASLTQSLLAFSRKQRISLEPHDLNHLIRNTGRLLKRLLPEDIRLEMSLADRELVVMADVSQIDQVLMNLATNARDAMPNGGTLTIETQEVTLAEGTLEDVSGVRPGRYVVFSVSDTGIGMDEAIKARVFDPFFTTKEVGKGTGLGLSSVYGIVKQHEGYVTVKSQPEQGSTFNVYLRLVEAELHQRVVRSEQVRRGAETILVAEDDADVRRLITLVLTSHGYSTLEAEDGEDAIRVFSEHKDSIALMIVDIVMPGKNGRQVFEEVRKIKPQVRTLFVSGYTGDVIIDKGIQSDAVDFLPKPLSVTKLLSKVREVLDR